MIDGVIFVYVEMFEYVYGGLMGVQVIVLLLVDEFVIYDVIIFWKKVRCYIEC